MGTSLGVGVGSGREKEGMAAISPAMSLAGVGEMICSCTGGRVVLVGAMVGGTAVPGCDSTTSTFATATAGCPWHAASSNKMRTLMNADRRGSFFAAFRRL